jgi:hypothetical protein
MKLSSSEEANDEILLVMNKPKHPKIRGNTRNKMEGPTTKKTIELPMRAIHKGKHQVP